MPASARVAQRRTSGRSFPSERSRRFTATGPTPRKASIAVGFTREPFTFYVAAACLYLLMTIVTMIGLQYAERAAQKGIPKARA